jgi:hypothetical protein
MTEKGNKTAESTNKKVLVCVIFGAVFGAILGLLFYINNWLG